MKSRSTHISAISLPLFTFAHSKEYGAKRCDHCYHKHRIGKTIDNHMRPTVVYTSEHETDVLGNFALFSWKVIEEAITATTLRSLNMILIKQGNHSLEI